MSSRLKNRDVYGADALQDLVERNAKWLQRFIVEGVRSLMRDNRPLFTEKIPERQRIEALLNAPPEYWLELQTNDPETAASLAASVVRARRDGKIPEVGPRAEEVSEDDMESPSLEVEPNVSI